MLCTVLGALQVFLNLLFIIILEDGHCCFCFTNDETNANIYLSN